MALSDIDNRSRNINNSRGILDMDEEEGEETAVNALITNRRIIIT